MVPAEVIGAAPPGRVGVRGGAPRSSRSCHSRIGLTMNIYAHVPTEIEGGRRGRGREAPLRLTWLYEGRDDRSDQDGKAADLG